MVRIHAYPLIKMTKFILHGGNTRIDNQDNKDFFVEFTKGFNVDKNINILLVYFAKDILKWKNLAKEDAKRIINLTKNKSITFEIANEKDFENQLKKADVVYFRGGDTYKLLEELKKISNLNLLFNNKTIVGSSAGVCVLFKYFYDNDYDKFDQGLGILNMKAFCHYDKSNKNKLRGLEEYKKDLKILVLPEFKYKVIHQN